MSGYATKAGIKLGQTWGAAWATVDTVIPMLSESLTAKADELRDESLIGQASETEFSLGTQKVAGDIVISIPYGIAGVAQLIGYAIGTYASGAITRADSLSSNVFHLEIDKIVNRYRFACCMISKLVIAGEIGSGKPVTATMSLIARSFATSATAFPSISLATSGAARVYGEHLRDPGYIYVGDCANALTSGDVLGAKSFELTIDNNLKADDVDSSSNYVLEPERDGMCKTSLKLGFARHQTSSAQFTTWRDAGTQLQAILNFSSSTTLRFRFPRLYVQSGADFNVSGPGTYGGDVMLDAFYNGSGGSARNAYMAVTDQVDVDFSAL